MYLQENMLTAEAVLNILKDIRINSLEELGEYDITIEDIKTIKEEAARKNIPYYKEFLKYLSTEFIVHMKFADEIFATE